eukprot:206565-Lingulodinium_polyedra.AAC.1
MLPELLVFIQGTRAGITWFRGAPKGNPGYARGGRRGMVSITYPFSFAVGFAPRNGKGSADEEAVFAQ